MNWFTKLVGYFRKDAAVVGGEIWGSTGGWGVSSSGVPVNAFTALQHAPLLSCVSILSEDVAKLPVQMFRRLPNGGKAEVRDHYLAKILRKPNDWQTRLEFIEQMTVNLILRGNAYAPITRDARGIPEQLIPVHPDRVTLFEAPGTDGLYFFFVTRQGLHEMAVLSSLPLMIAAEDIFHVRWLSTFNSLLGTSRISLLRESVGIGMGLDQHVARVMGQGARPGGVLQTDHKLTKEAFDRVATAWQQGHGGYANAGKTAILEDGLKYNPIEMSLANAEVLASRKYQLEEIARVLRVPRHLIGLPVEGEAAGLAQYNQIYWNSTISSYWDRFIAKFEELGDLDGDQLFVEADYSVLLRADDETRFKAYREAIAGSILTPNEVRRKEGMAEMPDGDQLFRPANLVPLDTPVVGAEIVKPTGGLGSDATGDPAPGGDGGAPGVARLSLNGSRHIRRVR
jgi:HK97 family phage portal protein